VTAPKIRKISYVPPEVALPAPPEEQRADSHMKYQFAPDFAESRGWRAAVVDDLTARPSKNSATGWKLPSSACAQCREILRQNRRPAKHMMVTVGNQSIDRMAHFFRNSDLNLMARNTMTKMTATMPTNFRPLKNRLTINEYLPKVNRMNPMVRAAKEKMIIIYPKKYS
jgi:hypothetical protein